jgi:hypothetical protein
MQKAVLLVLLVMGCYAEQPPSDGSTKALLPKQALAIVKNRVVRPETVADSIALLRRTIPPASETDSSEEAVAYYAFVDTLTLLLSRKAMWGSDAQEFMNLTAPRMRPCVASHLLTVGEKIYWSGREEIFRFVESAGDHESPLNFCAGKVGVSLRIALEAHPEKSAQPKA